MQEYSIHRSQRRCHETDREFAPGEAYYSAVLSRGSELARWDVSRDAWNGPPEGTIGWWLNRNPKRETQKRTPAPAHVLLSTLEVLLEDARQSELAYFLALILIRRRILVDQEDLLMGDELESGNLVQEPTVLHLTHNATNRDFVVPICAPSLEQSQSLQLELMQLLFTDA
jgi:hypothetical protein